MSDLKKRLLKSSTNKLTAAIDKSEFLNGSDMTRTNIPIMNIALSASLTGGLQSGLTILAGPSKHFKTNMSLVLVAAYMNKYPDAICLFYDSEFGAAIEYFKMAGIDISRVIHTPVQDVAQLKIDLTNQLNAINRGDKVIVFIDSIGNLASKKEVEDALNEKSVAEMSRAKDIKGMFRVITPFFGLKDIPCIAVNHTIQTMEMFSKEVMTGGQGPTLSAQTVIFIGKRQVKDGSELEGFEFVLKINKSRKVIEGSKFPITVKFDGGIDPYSGLLDIALGLGFVIKPKNGWYSRCFSVNGEIQQEQKSWRAKDTNCKEFWAPLFKHEPFRLAIENEYRLKEANVRTDIAQEIEDILDADISDAIDVKLADGSPSEALIEAELEDYDA